MFKKLKERIENILIIPALFLSQFLYIGARALEAKIFTAAREVGREPSPEKIEEVASRYGISPDTLSKARGHMDKPAEHYISPYTGKQLYEVTYEGRRYITPIKEFEPKAYKEAKAKPLVKEVVERLPKFISKTEAARMFYAEGVMPLYGGAIALKAVPKKPVEKRIFKEVKGYVPLFREKIQEVKPSRLLGLYERIEARVSPYVKKIIPKPEYRPEIPTFYDVMLPKKYAKPVKVRTEAFGVGMIRGVREKPVKAGLMFGAFFGLSGALRVAGMGLAATGVKIWKPIKIGFAVGFAGLYGISLRERLKREPTPRERWGLAGEVTTTELAPMFAGGYAGELVWPKVFGRIETRWMRRVPPEEIIEPRVAMGEEAFPTAPTRVHLKKFLEPTYRLPGVKEELGVWHATSRAWARKTLTRMSKRRELPGTYVAPSLSGYFLRVQQEQIGFYGIELFPAGRPTAIYIYPKGITGLRMPRSKMYQYLLGKAPKGKAFVPGIKGEIEALIPPETRVFRIAKQFYTEWRGVRIPIHEYKVAGLGVTPSKKMITPKELSAAYYSYFKPKPATSPLSYALLKSLTTVPYRPAYEPSYKALAVSYVTPYKPSKVSYKLPQVSYVTSYRPSRVSYAPPYKPSYVLPYKPTYRPPYKPSYVPPYIPPYVPPYKPTYRPPYKPPYVPPYKPTYRPPYRPPPPITPFPFIPGVPIPKKRKMIKAVKRLRYLPSLEPVARGWYGKKPKFLTGLEQRFLQAL